MNKKSHSDIPAPLDCLVRQQDHALSIAGELRQKASKYKQMGFRELARFCNENANKAVSSLKKMLETFTNSKLVAIGALEGGDVKQAQFSKGKVFLDAAETPELVEERLFREVSRLIQDLRKQKGLDVSQKAVVYADGSMEFLKRWKTVLESKTNSELQFRPLKNGKEIHFPASGNSTAG